RVALLQDAARVCDWCGRAGSPVAAAPAVSARLVQPGQRAAHVGPADRGRVDAQRPHNAVPRRRAGQLLCAPPRPWLVAPLCLHHVGGVRHWVCGRDPAAAHWDRIGDWVRDQDALLCTSQVRRGNLLSEFLPHGESVI
ncbi:hypothetical protein HK405_016051, partial [Cladochytrium tenue]